MILSQNTNAASATKTSMPSHHVSTSQEQCGYRMCSEAHPLPHKEAQVDSVDIKRRIHCPNHHSGLCPADCCTPFACHQCREEDGRKTSIKYESEAIADDDDEVVELLMEFFQFSSVTINRKVSVIEPERQMNTTNKKIPPTVCRRFPGSERVLVV
jgi:hypothetical protein